MLKSFHKVTQDTHTEVEQEREPGPTVDTHG